jgi:hypothetical protein
MLAVLDRQSDIVIIAPRIPPPLQHKFNGPHQPLDSETMSRCAFCHTFTIDQDRFYLEFHPNLASLKKSADDGCDFCHLCWTGFRQEWTGAQIESVLKGEVPEGVTKFEPGIWIYVHFTDYSPTLTQPRIIVSCGRYNPITSVRESSHGLGYINLAVYG